MAAYRPEMFFIPRPMVKCKRNCLSWFPFNVVAVQAVPQFYSLLGWCSVLFKSFYLPWNKVRISP